MNDNSSAAVGVFKVKHRPLLVETGTASPPSILHITEDGKKAFFTRDAAIILKNTADFMSNEQINVLMSNQKHLGFKYFE